MTTPKPIQTTRDVKLATLTPHPENPRRSDTGHLRESLARFGQYRPIVVQKSTMHIIAGNHTAQAATEEGWTTIKATILDVDDATARAILVADNRLADLGTYEQADLTTLLQTIDDESSLVGTGYTTGDLKDLFKAASLDMFDPDERYTPLWIFEAMEAEFDIDLATSTTDDGSTIPARQRFTKEDDALQQPWTGLFAWCNPPFSHASKFGQKWLAEIEEGVWLGPVSHSTNYRTEMWRRARLIWMPHELEFTRSDGFAEGIGFPVFLGGFGDRGYEALRTLARHQPDAGVLLRAVTPQNP